MRGIFNNVRSEVAFMQRLIELIQYDVRQQLRDHTALRHTFTGRPEETNINMPSLDCFHSW